MIDNALDKVPLHKHKDLRSDSQNECLKINDR